MSVGLLNNDCVTQCVQSLYKDLEGVALNTGPYWTVMRCVTYYVHFKQRQNAFL